MFKRFLVLMVAAVAVVGLLVAGCAPEPAPPEEEEPAPPEEEPAAPEEEVIRWRMQSWAAAADPTHKATERYAATVQEISEGRLVIDTFPAGGVAPVRGEHEAVIKGTVEAIMAPDGWMEEYNKASYLFSQYVDGPTGIQLMLWDLAGGGRDLAREMVEDYPIHFVGPLTVHPAEVDLHTTKRIDSLDDLQGFKLRMGSAPLAAIYERLGAAPVVMSGAEIYESAQRGVIDGFEYVTPNVNWEMGFQEVSDYMYLSPVRAPADRQSIWVNEDAWNELSPELQVTVEKTAEALVPRFFAETVDKDAVALEKFEEYGVEVLATPEDIEEELKRVAEEYFGEIAAEEPFFGKVIESQSAWKAACEEMNIQ